MINKKTLKQKSLERVSDPVKSLIVMSNNAQRVVNPCSINNGGCQEICFFDGLQTICHCFHGKLAKDGKSCNSKIMVPFPFLNMYHSCDELLEK